MDIDQQGLEYIIDVKINTLQLIILCNKIWKVPVVEIPNEVTSQCHMICESHDVQAPKHRKLRQRLR